MAYPAVASSSTDSSGSGTATGTFLSLPSGVTSGDLLVATFAVAGFASPGSLSEEPAGWTRLTWGASYPDLVHYIYWKISDGADDDPQLAWAPTFYAYAAGCLRITGAHASAPLYVDAGNSGSSSTPTAPTVATSETDTLLLSFASQTAGTSYTAPSGMTEVFDVAASGGASTTVARLDGPSNPSGTKAFTASSSRQWIAFNVGVKPTAAAVDATVTPAAGEMSLAGPPAGYSSQTTFPDPGVMVLTDLPVVVSTPDATVSPDVGALLVGDLTAAALSGISVSPDCGTLVLADLALSPVTTVIVTPATGGLVLAGPVTVAVVIVEHPHVTVEFSPATGPFDTPVWVDITDWALGVDWKIGREHALQGEYTPATANVRLANESRRFDPEYTAGPYYSQLTPGRRLRIRVTYDGITYDCFAGFVEGWPQTYQFPELADCDVTATDGLTLLGWSETNSSPLEAMLEDLTPVHWWRLDEKAGATEVADSGSSPRTGFPIGGAQDSLGFTPGVDRIAETGCLQLRNSGGGYINVTGATQWTTFSALCKGDPVPGQGVDYLWSSTVDGTIWQFVGMYGNTGRFTASDGTTQRTTSGAYNDGDVHLVTVVSASGTCNIYVDGVLDNGSNSPADPAPASYAAAIGNHIAPNETKWNGKVGHVALWTSALTSTQIASLQESIVGWDDDTSGDRVGHLLDLAGWPSADRDISTEGVTLGAVNGQDWTGDVLANIKVVEASEGGQFYQQPDYIMRFRDRLEPLTDPRSTTPRYVFSDEDTTGVYRYESLTFGEQSTYLYNRVKVTYTGGEITVSDDTSVAAYGPRDHTISTTLGTAAQARNLADAVLYQYSYPRLIVESIELNPAADARLWLPCLDLQIGDRVTVRRHPQEVGDPIEVDVIVEGITGTIGDGINTGVFVLSCSTPMSPGGGSGGGGGGGDDFWTWGTGEWGTSTRWA